ncbi:Isotrichodermin C-15 hydroxylase 16 [Colletotrichum plurivorum]|uniref:Isotrichodermin C-15 hydroxylase 16 n=1 Tax=Colletotrichum plurivorum TaxID=2175906 RepID=A0A8H6JVH1_9PEZI|nr:Isotrichodermin C-15 hydroxylase 16 [Colletotrichum plurivorum]
MLVAGVLLLLFPFAALSSTIVKGLAYYYLSLGNDIPGPLSHRFSSLPKTYHLLKGDLPSHVAKLHAKYGSVVRMAPNELAFAARRHGETYTAIAQLEKRRREEHGRIRRRLSHGFSDKYLRNQEPIIREYIDLLIRKLHEKATGSAAVCAVRVDMCEWLNWTIFDIIGDLGLGGSFGCLESCSYHPWVRMVTSTLRLNTYLQVLAGMRAKRIVQRISNSSILKTREQSRALIAEKLAKRLELTDQRPDFVDSLVRNKDDGVIIMSFPQLAINASALTIAGSETTATLLSGAIFLLTTNVGVLGKLAREIRSSFKDDCEITMASVSELPYLVACLNESLRCYLPVPAGLPRVVPEGGAPVAGRFIPGGTTVAVWQWAINYDPKLPSYGLTLTSSTPKGSLEIEGLPAIN